MALNGVGPGLFHLAPEVTIDGFKLPVRRNCCYTYWRHSLKSQVEGRLLTLAVMLFNDGMQKSMPDCLGANNPTLLDSARAMTGPLRKWARGLT